MNLGVSDAKVVGADDEHMSEESGDQSRIGGDWERSALDQAEDRHGQPPQVAGMFGNRPFRNLEARVAPAGQGSRPRGEAVKAARPGNCVVSCLQDPGVLVEISVGGKGEDSSAEVLGTPHSASEDLGSGCSASFPSFLLSFLFFEC